MSACDRILKNTSISLGLERWPHMCEARTKPMQLARPDKNVETSSPGREEGVSVAIATQTFYSTSAGTRQPHSSVFTFSTTGHPRVIFIYINRQCPPVIEF